MSRSNNVCLVKVSHLLCFKVRIWLIITIALGLSSTCLSMTREDSGNGWDRWNIVNLPLLEFPMNDLCTNASKGRTAGLVRLQFFSDGENLFNYMPEFLCKYTLGFQQLLIDCL